jgi:flagellar biogenesis protein FliO
MGNQTSFLLVEVLLLGLLISFFVGIAIFLKRKQLTISGKKGFTKELERFYYLPRSFISVILIDDEVFVLGVTEQSINIIKKYDNSESTDKFLSKKAEREDGKSFSDYFSFKNNEVEELKNRLKKMRKSNNEEN